MNLYSCLNENKRNSVIGRQEKIKLTSNKSEAKMDIFLILKNLNTKSKESSFEYTIICKIIH